MCNRIDIIYLVSTQYKNQENITSCEKCGEPLDEPVSQILIKREGDKTNTRAPTSWVCKKCGHNTYRDYDHLKTA